MINNLASGTQFDAGSPMSIYNSFISSENQLKIASFVNSLLDSHSKKSFSRYRPLSFALVDEFSTFLLMRIDRLFDLSFDRPLIVCFFIYFEFILNLFNLFNIIIVSNDKFHFIIFINFTCYYFHYFNSFIKKKY